MNRNYIRTDFDGADFQIARDLSKRLARKPYTHAITVTMEKIHDGERLTRAATNDVARLGSEIRILANRLHKRANARRTALGLETAQIEFFGAPEVTTRLVHEICLPHFHCAFRLDEVLNENDLNDILQYMAGHSTRTLGYPLDIECKPITNIKGWMSYCVKNTHIDNPDLYFIFRGEPLKQWVL